MPFGIGKDTVQDTQFRPDSHGHDFDFSSILGHAEQNGSSRSDLLNAAVNYLKENSGRFSKEDVDEERAVKAHKVLYEGKSDDSDKHDSESLGMGAALQALKLFMGQSHGGSGDKNQLIGLAMAQAEKLFDQKAAEGKASGDKQAAVNKAAELAFKMYTKSHGSGLTGTGGPGGGLLGLANKFLSK